MADQPAHNGETMEAFERRIVRETVAVAVEISRGGNYEINDVFPVQIVDLRDHQELFSTHLYSRLAIDLTVEAERESWVRFFHMYPQSLTCYFSVHRK